MVTGESAYYTRGAEFRCTRAYRYTVSYCVYNN